MSSDRAHDNSDLRRIAEDTRPTHLVNPSASVESEWTDETGEDDIEFEPSSTDSGEAMEEFFSQLLDEAEEDDDEEYHGVI